MKFFYMDNCDSSVTNSVNSDIKGAIYKLIRHVEAAYSVKVQKVCDNNTFLNQREKESRGQRLTTRGERGECTRAKGECGHPRAPRVVNR